MEDRGWEGAGREICLALRKSETTCQRLESWSNFLGSSEPQDLER